MFVMPSVDARLLELRRRTPDTTSFDARKDSLE
jgi:hypothetical protein